jgi:hypothetical protein
MHIAPPGKLGGAIFLAFAKNSLVGHVTPVRAAFQCNTPARTE